ncbi:penicillin-insensitive murein endopeptidase [Myxococcus sp. RHSTA-1-4]|uniref:penicillin-insensitive murein endopeptidase n=1 Tax=Myxococcus sp. RHSTA-1-4 TaxID=2874601 RepID=UPI001CBE4FAF|nr:penicillin-insensitive murein endopeptidase [Myxococcus sp. RHSTA-1-4]MBZ4420633.1 penicillin-insensitive murein endopeptidase [Myxococcus sp. RHSTA-1-4]
MSLSRVHGPWKSLSLLVLTLGAAPVLAREPSFCGEQPTPHPRALSVGRASRGELRGARALESDDAVRLLPRRHLSRCLNWATPRLVAALKRAGEAVRRHLPDSPPLGVGDLSRAAGGPIPPYSRSHQSGRDADLAFFQVDEQGQPVPAEDLLPFDTKGRASEGRLRFDARRTWLVVRALLEDPEVDVQWMFISNALRRELLEEARRLNEPAALVERAASVLHQPTDSSPHDDHVHLRIRCTPEERAEGCRD